MTANTTAERSTNTLSVPAGTYTLELQGTAASGVNVTPYFQTHTNWSNYQLPVEASGRTNGQLDPKPWTGNQTWTVTLNGTGTHFDLRLTGTAVFTVTRVILRTNTPATTTTTTSAATTTTPPTTTPRGPASVAPGITKFDEYPASTQADWHAWWGTAVTFNPTTGSMTANTNTERNTKTLPAPLAAGAYELEVQGPAAPSVNVTPYVQTHTNWANYQLPIEAAGRPNGQLDPKPWTGIQYWPVTFGDTSTHLDLRFGGTAQFSITRVILRTAPLPTAVTFGVSNAPDAVLPGQSFPIILTNAIAGRDTLELLDGNGALVATGTTLQFTATTPATYTVQARHDGAIVSTTPLTVTPAPTMTVTPPNAVVAGEAIPVTVSNGLAGHDSVTITGPSGTIIASYPALAGLQIVAPPTGTYTATLYRDSITLSTTQLRVNPTPTIALNSGSGYSEGFPLDVILTGGALDLTDRVRIDAVGQADDCTTCDSDPKISKQAIASMHFDNTPKAGAYQAKLLRRGHTIALKTFTTVALPSPTLTLWRMDARYDLDNLAPENSPTPPGCERWWWNHGLTGYSPTYVPRLSAVLVGDQPGAGTTIITNPQDERSLPFDFCAVSDPRATILENQLTGHPKLKLRMSGYTAKPGDYIQVGPSLRASHDSWFSPADLGTSWKEGFSEVAISYHTTIAGRDTAIGFLETGIIYHAPVTPAPVCVIGPDRFKQITGQDSPPVGVFFYIIGDSCNDQYPILVFTNDPQGTQERPGQRYTTGPNAGQIAPNRARNPGGNGEGPTDPPDNVEVPVVTAPSLALITADVPTPLKSLAYGGQCLSVNEGNSSVVLGDCSEQWVPRLVAGGYNFRRFFDSSACLTASGTNLTVSTCSSSTSQVFREGYRLGLLYSTLKTTVSGSEVCIQTDGTSASVATCTGDAVQQWADDYPYLHYCQTHDCDALESPPAGLNDRERSLWDEINAQQLVAGTIFSQVKTVMCISNVKGCVGKIFRFLNLAHWASQQDVALKTGSAPEGTIPGTRFRVDVYRPGFTSIAEIKPNNPFSVAAGAGQLVVYTRAISAQLGIAPTLGLGVTGSWVSFSPMFLVTTIKTTYVGGGLFGYECSGIPTNSVLEAAMQGQTFRQFVNQWVTAANIDPTLAAGTSTPKAFAKALLRAGYSTWTAAAAVFARFGTSFAEGLNTVANSLTSPISAFTVLVGIVTLIAAGTLD